LLRNGSISNDCSRRIRHAVEEAIESASLSSALSFELKDVCSTHFQDVWVGVSRLLEDSLHSLIYPPQIAGCDTPSDEAKISPHLSTYLYAQSTHPYKINDLSFPSQRPITPTNDALLLASDALLSGARYSIALVAGTGSVILGLEIPLTEAEGTRKPVVKCRKGGNGHLLGDHGSGMSSSCTRLWMLLIRAAYHLGVTAARIAADDYSMRRRTDTPLYGQLCAHYGVDSPGDLPARIVCPQTPKARETELISPSAAPTGPHARRNIIIQRTQTPYRGLFSPGPRKHHTLINKSSIHVGPFRSSDRPILCRYPRS
jgi:hypothetical protein